MGSQASRWALLASVAIHAAIVVFPLLARRAGRAGEGRVDFWAGNTFEPSEVADPGASTLGGEDRLVEVEGDWSAPTPQSEAAVPPEPSDDVGDVRVARKRASAAVSRVARAHPPGAGAPSRAGANSQASGERPGGGTFGAEGGATGTRDLLRSFVRALPTVASSDSVWATLPLGSAGSAELGLDTDGDNKPRLADGVPGGVPSHLRRLIEKTMVVLSGGRFAPTAEAASRGSRVRVAVTLSQLRAPSDAERAAGGVFGLGFEGADAHQVSRAFFTLTSGRHVEISVKRLSR